MNDLGRESDHAGKRGRSRGRSSRQTGGGARRGWGGACEVEKRRGREGREGDNEGHPGEGRTEGNEEEMKVVGGGSRGTGVRGG